MKKGKFMEIIIIYNSPKVTMSIKKRRFVFTEFATLQHVSFEKLQKVCDKLFVLIHQHEKHIPLQMVLSMQQMGKNAKWIVVPTRIDKPLDYHLSYLLGKLDEKLSDDIEFAVVSSKDILDPLIDYMNLSGRSCLRVTLEETTEVVEEEDGEDLDLEEADYLVKDGESEDYEDDTDLQIDLTESTGKPTAYEVATKSVETVAVAESTTDIQDIEKKAEETVERLKYTGNRPMEVVLLRDYISLFHQGIEEDDGQADQIINKLVENKLIEVRKGVINYNF